MLLIDEASGTFAFSFRAEDTNRNLPELVMQVWAPFDYLTVEWDAFVMPEVIGELAAVLFIWAIDDQGAEHQVSLGTVARELFSGDLDGAGAGLTGVNGLPPMVPEAIRRGVEARQAARTTAWEEVAACLADSEGRNVWLRLFGGSTVGGRVKDNFQDALTLDRARRLSPLEDGYAPSFVRLSRIASARIDPRRRIPKRVASPEFSEWMRQTDFAEIPPQLWGALCGECINAIRPLWRTGLCYRCRSGKPIELPSYNLAEFFQE